LPAINISMSSAIPCSMHRRFETDRARRPGELRLAMRAACVRREGVERTAASIRTAYPLHSHRGRETARWTGDVGARLTWPDGDDHSIRHQIPRCARSPQSQQPRIHATPAAVMTGCRTRSMRCASLFINAGVQTVRRCTRAAPRRTRSRALPDIDAAERVSRSRNPRRTAHETRGSLSSVAARRGRDPWRR
jgi:hypothetical protein